MNAWRRLFQDLVILAAVQAAYYQPQLPALVASHFDARGVPNDWPGKNVFFGIYLSMIAMLTRFFILLPRWSKGRIGFGMKIPNRNYCLATEGAEQTRTFSGARC
jgi:uncharacterized membrane protein